MTDPSPSSHLLTLEANRRSFTALHLTLSLPSVSLIFVLEILVDSVQHSVCNLHCQFAMNTSFTPGDL